MTANEHKLMVFMFTRQTMLLNAFAELLKSREILQGDDVEAFEALVRAQENLDRAVLQSVSSQYTSWATLLGLANDLPRADKA